MRDEPTAQQPCFESGDGSSDMTIPVVVGRILVRRCGNRLMALTRLAAVVVLAAFLWSAGTGSAGALASVSRGSDALLADHASVQTAPTPQVGETQIFFAEDWGNQAVIQVEGVMRAVGQHCVVYLQWGRSFPDVLLQDLVSEYDTNVYPKVTAALGAIPGPGVDGESRVVILLYGFNGPAIMGSFFRGDLLPRGSTALSPSEMATSNHRDMFYLNLDAILLQPGKAASTAAHELGHLIVFYHDFMLDPSPRRTDEDQWVQEGLAVYAELAAGYPERAWPYLLSFQMSPDKNLTYWGGFNSDYGASYAFVTYLVDRLGPDFPAQLVSETRDGISGVTAVLAARGRIRYLLQSLRRLGARRFPRQPAPRLVALLLPADSRVRRPAHPLRATAGRRPWTRAELRGRLLGSSSHGGRCHHDRLCCT